MLNHVAVLVVNRAVCYERYQEYADRIGAAWSVNDNMICAGLLDIGGTFSCLKFTLCNLIPVFHLFYDISEYVNKRAMRIRG